MKKKKLFAAVLSAVCILGTMPAATVLADGQRVVTLGADLSPEQKNAILNYFGVAGKNIQTLTITNQDERDHLGSYVPLEQIGTRTFSCAYVCPTKSGGIQVKTANLTWVTSNMIASTLSTSGVVNCDVLAAAPFEVSGTGALTGILMAYESAVGTELDSTKKEIATQELITTTKIADNIGQVQATEIVNEAKMQVIQGNVVSNTDINVIINDVAKDEDISLSEEDQQLLNDLLVQISQQDYNYEEMRETLERVEDNLQDLNSQMDADSEEEDYEEDYEDEDDFEELDDWDDEGFSLDDVDSIDEDEELDEDSILMNTDDSALGDSVVFDATNSSAITTEPEDTEDDFQDDGFDDFEITNSDSYGDDSGDGDEEIWDDGSDGSDAEIWDDGSDDGNAEIWDDGSDDGDAEIWDDGSDVEVYPEENGGEDIVSDGTDIENQDGEIFGEEFNGELSGDPAEAGAIPAVYTDIIQKYLTAANEGWDFETLAANELCELVAYNSSADELGYYAEDINFDGIKELIIGEKNPEGYTGMFYALYTIENDSAKLLAQSTERDRYYLCSDCSIVEEGSGSADFSFVTNYILDSYATELTFVESVLYNGSADPENPWFYSTEDVDYDSYSPISESEAMDIMNSYDYSSIDYTALTE